MALREESGAAGHPGHDEGPAPAGTANGAQEARDASELRIPDVPVQDQDGRRLRFYTDLVKGKTVAIDFIFTTCTTICPTLTATFRRVQKELAGRNISFISVSVDPTTDVPERLKEFARKFGAGPGWTFVTGERPEMDGLLRALGAYAGDKNDHSPMILVGNDEAGYWTRTYGLAPASDIVKMIEEAAGKSPSYPDDGSEGAAAYFPNLTLVDQHGKPVRFFDDMLKGKVVVINFMFSTCKEICPLTTANLAKVQGYLGDRVGRDVNIISITVDPAVDTPEVLGKYAHDHGAKPGWRFLTGKKENVDWVLYKLGGYVEEKGDHSTFLIIGNEATGQWMKLFAMSKPSIIADEIVKMIRTAKR